MFHLVARANRRLPVWSTWDQGRALWDRILRACPGPTAIVLMPDHVHLLHSDDVRQRLAQALAGHTRSTGGPGFERLPSAEPVADAQKKRRSIRYVHLNPCRARLCSDPLAWPLSSHLDACGLAISPVVRPRPDPAGFHRYVSSDPHVSVQGTDLPGEQLSRVPAIQILHAVSALCRAPMSRLRRRGPARTLYLAAASELSGQTQAEIAALVGVHPTSVGRARATWSDTRRVRRVLGDPRLTPLLEGRLPWAR